MKSLTIPRLAYLLGTFLLVLALQGCAILSNKDSSSLSPSTGEQHVATGQNPSSVSHTARLDGSRTDASTKEHAELTDEGAIIDVPGTGEDEHAPDDPFYDPFAEAVPEVRDPWEPFNNNMFAFNRKLDQYVMKPVATGYDTVVPDAVERGIKNAFHNFGVVSRLVNNMLQAKYRGAGLEVSRFFINSTIGVVGFFDVAKEQFDLETPDEDLGQTLAVYGVDSGPYLILPFFAPVTVRDTARLVDGAMNPVYWLYLPFVATAGLNVEERVNDRALNLELYQGVEESTVDLYGAVRDAYLQSRAKAIRE